MVSKLSTRRDLPAEVEVFISLARAHALLMGEVDALLAQHGLSEPQFNALRIIRGAGPKGLPTQRIGARLISRQPDVTRLIDRLCEAGLVARRRCPEDRRVVYVMLTREGRKKLTSVDPRVAALHRRQFQHMPRNRVELLGELLAELRGRE